MPKSNLSRVAGVLDASNFAYGVNPNAPAAVVLTGNSTTGAGSSIVVRAPQPFHPAAVELSDGTTLQAFATTAPITINDANLETVTPSAVSINTDGTVTITANFSYTHGQGALVTSGTVGLQEAINYGSGVLTGAVVVVDAAWVALGGTQAILDAATGAPTVSLLDNRGPIPTIYSGSADAIAFPARINIATLTTAGVDACTLATPGAADAGKLLIVSSTTAEAHTVTTAANKIQDGSGTNGDTLTFGAHAGANFVLLAVNGYWQVVALKNVTLSEV